MATALTLDHFVPGDDSVVPDISPAYGTLSMTPKTLTLTPWRNSTSAAASDSPGSVIGTPDWMRVITPPGSAAPSAMAGAVEQDKGTAVGQVVLPSLLGKRPAETAFEV